MSWAYIQGTGIQYTGTQSAGSKAFSSNITAGHLIVVGITCYNPGSSITVTDSLSNSYSLAVKEQPVTTTGGAQIFYSVATTGGACTVTVTPAAGSTYLSFSIDEYSFTGSGVSVDSTGTGTNTSTTPATGALSPTGTDLVVGTVYTGGANTSYTAGTGMTLTYTANYGSNKVGIASEYDLNVSGSITPAVTLGSSCIWYMASAAFLPTGGGGGSLFRVSPMSGLGVGGPFFSDPMSTT